MRRLVRSHGSCTACSRRVEALAALALVLAAACSRGGSDMKQAEATTEVQHHPNGKKSAEGPLRDGAKHGHWTTWDADGQVTSEGDYRAGVKDGAWLESHLEGAELVVERGTRIAGRREGPWKVTTRAGTPVRDEQWHNDVMEGPWRRYHPNGKLAEDGARSGNKAHGHWTYYYPDGQKQKEGDFDHGAANGPWRGWYPDGKPEYEGTWDHDTPTGSWARWAPDGTRRDGAP